MKNATLLMLASALLVSCKRSYTCECKDMAIGSYSIETIKNMNRDDAKIKCEQKTNILENSMFH